MKLALHTLAIACSAAMVSAASAHTLALASSEQQPSSDTEQTQSTATTGQNTQSAPSTSASVQDSGHDVSDPPGPTGTDSAQPVTPDTSATQPAAPGSTTTPPPAPDTQTQQGTAPGVAPATPPTDAQGDDTMADARDFLENAIQGSYAEIEGSQLALEKAEDPEVREFAEMMIRDHQQMAQEASDLARQKGIEPPDGPSIMQTTEITALKPLTGGAFEAMYVNRIGVAAHESTIEMFEQAQQEIQDPDVRAMIEKPLPKLREHLQMAQALDQKQDNQ